MLDQNRLAVIADVIRVNKVGNQHELKDLLQERGLDTTQAFRRELDGYKQQLAAA